MDLSKNMVRAIDEIAHAGGLKTQTLEAKRKRLLFETKSVA